MVVSYRRSGDKEFITERRGIQWKWNPKPELEEEEDEEEEEEEEALLCLGTKFIIGIIRIKIGIGCRASSVV